MGRLPQRLRSLPRNREMRCDFGRGKSFFVFKCRENMTVDKKKESYVHCCLSHSSFFKDGRRTLEETVLNLYLLHFRSFTSCFLFFCI